MKCFVVLILCFSAVVYCEPPRYRSNRLRSARQETSTVADENATEDAVTPKAPYPPSGWKPAGQRLELPTFRSRVSASPPSVYLPAAEYGPPTTPVSEETTATTDVTTTVSEETTTTVDETSTAEAVTMPPPATGGSGSAEDIVESMPFSQNLNEQGSYYVLLPDSRLQRILYSVNSDPEKLQFSSRLQSIGTQALTGPLIFYTPQYIQTL